MRLRAGTSPPVRSPSRPLPGQTATPIATFTSHSTRMPRFAKPKRCRASSTPRPSHDCTACRSRSRTASILLVSPLPVARASTLNATASHAKTPLWPPACVNLVRSSSVRASHQLPYGITGQNPDYGDCVQTNDALRLTGGSSSGAAASVQEGSAVAAIGTDTGGSIRAPAALCGLAGYRASIDLAHQRGLWRGGVHLAPSFDTLGWLFRDLRDAPLLAEALFGLSVPREADANVRMGACPTIFCMIANRRCSPVSRTGGKGWKNPARKRAG